MDKAQVTKIKRQDINLPIRTRELNLGPGFMQKASEGFNTTAARIIYADSHGTKHYIRADGEEVKKVHAPTKFDDPIMNAATHMAMQVRRPEPKRRTPVLQNNIFSMKSIGSLQEMPLQMLLQKVNSEIAECHFTSSESGFEDSKTEIAISEDNFSNSVTGETSTMPVNTSEYSDTISSSCDTTLQSSPRYDEQETVSPQQQLGPCRPDFTDSSPSQGGARPMEINLADLKRNDKEQEEHQEAVEAKLTAHHEANGDGPKDSDKHMTVQQFVSLLQDAQQRIMQQEKLLQEKEKLLQQQEQALKLSQKQKKTHVEPELPTQVPGRQPIRQTPPKPQCHQCQQSQHPPQYATTYQGQSQLPLRNTYEQSAVPTLGFSPRYQQPIIKPLPPARHIPGSQRQQQTEDDRHTAAKSSKRKPSTPRNSEQKPCCVPKKKWESDYDTEMTTDIDSDFAVTYRKNHAARAKALEYFRERMRKSPYYLLNQNNQNNQNQNNQNNLYRHYVNRRKKDAARSQSPFWKDKNVVASIMNLVYKIFMAIFAIVMMIVGSTSCCCALSSPQPLMAAIKKKLQARLNKRR